MAERVFLDRHPYEYVLIGKPEKIANSKHMIFEGLFRLHPEHEVPEGYIRVDHIWGRPVYKEDGKLDPRFGAVRRWNID